MKNKKILVVSLLMGLVALVTGKVLAEVNNLPVISRGCETRSGFLLVKDDDGFSRLRRCPRGTREVVIGEGGQVSGDDGSGSSSDGYVLFIGYPYVLSRDGNVWYKEVVNEETGEEEWTFDEAFAIEESITENIVQWDGAGLQFLLDDGSIYQYDRGLGIWSNQEGIVNPSQN